jgi:hypothetical protein
MIILLIDVEGESDLIAELQPLDRRNRLDRDRFLAFPALFEGDREPG